jgi:uncharacterized membrane protein
MQINVEHAQAGAGADAPARAARARPRRDLVLGSAAVASGLLAGVYYGYACSVMPGLHAASDRTAVEAMQQINEAIQNPVFFATFMGGPALAIWAFVRERRRGSSPAMRSVAAGAALGVVGLLVSFAFNIPLNDKLMEAGDPSTIADIAKVRDDFEMPWTIWNVVRTLITAGSFCCLARALVLRGRR